MTDTDWLSIGPYDQPIMSAHTCQQQLMREGKPYPRTCAICRLGPCHFLKAATAPTEQSTTESPPTHDELVEKLEALSGLLNPQAHNRGLAIAEAKSLRDILRATIAELKRGEGERESCESALSWALQVIERDAESWMQSNGYAIANRTLHCLQRLMGKIPAIPSTAAKEGEG